MNSNGGSTAQAALKAGPWIRLQNLSKFVTYWRNTRQFAGAVVGSMPLGARTLLDTSRFTSPTVYYECTGSAPILGSFGMNLATVGANDTSATPSAITNGAIAYPSTSKMRVRAASSLSLTDGDRYLSAAVGLAGSHDTTSCWVILKGN